MESNNTLESSTLDAGLLRNGNVSQEHDDDDVRKIAMTFMTYKIGEALNQSYFLIIVPIGVIGNLLSFLVMIQPHNRHMSFSMYISILAVTDTISLIIGFSRYLNMAQDIQFPPNQFWYCTYATLIFFTSQMCSTLFMLNMTFERFYSIIRPHKAASFNTVKRAKITIVCSITFSIVYNFPHLFITSDEGDQCVPYGNARAVLVGELYYWLSYVMSFALPFALLLIMNSVIIHTLRQRSNSSLVNQGQGQDQRVKKSETQIYVTLLLVTFGFLIFVTPAYMLFLYTQFVDYERAPKLFAGFHLFFSVAQKALYTNYAINFFLYVMSGQKFRNDLLKLFRIKRKESNESSVASNQSTELQTRDTDVA